MKQGNVAKYLIYGLMDPRSLLIRYIGRSARGLARARTHRHKIPLAANTRCATWIKSLLNAGLTYDVVVLETVASSEMLNEAERWWIAYALLSEWPLTNHTLGGEGTLGVSPSPESRANRSAKLRGRVFSKEHRARISAAKHGAPKSEDHKHKLSTAVTRLWQDDEYRERQRATRFPLREETHVRA